MKMDLVKLVFKILAYMVVFPYYIFYTWSKPVLKNRYKNYNYFEWFMLHKFKVDMRISQ